MSNKYQTKEGILNALIEILEEYFEIPAEKVCLEAKLYDDLDIDSIDAVDLMVNLKKITGEKIDAEIFKSVRTVEDVVEAVYQALN